MGVSLSDDFRTVLYSCPSPPSPPADKLTRAAGAPAPDASTEALPADFNAWYPALQNAILCLSKIFPVLDASIFGGLAQDAVAAATASLEEAAHRIARTASPWDGQLFLIKHLMILREHLTSFDVEFLVTDVDLDFSHLREQLRKIVAGDFSVFSLARGASFSQLLNRGPRVLESQMDPRKDLDRQLRAACEQFIMGVTKSVVEPVLSFITKVTALRATAADAAATPPLREQAFASADRVVETAEKVRTALRETLPKVAGLVALYLNNPAFLLDPVRFNILEAQGQFAAILEAEYPESDRARVEMFGEGDLDAVLGGRKLKGGAGTGTDVGLVMASL